MGVFKKLVFPARFGIVLCFRWFNFAPLKSIVFLFYYCAALGFSIFPAAELIVDWNIYSQIDAVIGPTSTLVVSLVVVGSFLLIWIINVTVAWAAIVIFVFGACTAMPPEYNRAYKLLQRFAQNKVRGKVPSEH